MECVDRMAKAAPSRCARSLKLIQREGREVQRVLVDGRQVLLCGREERFIDAASRRWLPPIEQRRVAGGAPAQQLHPGEQFGIGRGPENNLRLAFQPPREERHADQPVRGALVRGVAPRRRQPGRSGRPGMGRPQRDGPIRAPRRGNMPKSVRIHSHVQPTQDWRVVHEVVGDEDEHHQGGAEMPRELVVVRQLVDLAGGMEAERRRRDVQAGQLPGGHLFQPNVELVGDGDVRRLDEGIADHGDVTARRGPLDADGFAVQEAQAVGSRLDPEIKVVRKAHLHVGRICPPNCWRPNDGTVGPCEGHPQPPNTLRRRPQAAPSPP